MGPPPKVSPPNTLTSPVVQLDYWAGQLSQKRQTIGRQLEALDALTNILGNNRTALDLLRGIPGSETKGETLLSLLLNLAKHQDKLLAYKAGQLLEKKRLSALACECDGRE